MTKKKQNAVSVYELDEEWTGRPSIDQEEQDWEIRKFLDDQKSSNRKRKDGETIH